MTTYSPLINSEKITIISSCNIRIIYFILFIIVTLQACCIAYIIILAKIAENINLFDLNTTETNEYIDKFKIIIDSVCATMIKC
jgi:hypothetical protein